MAFNSRTVTGNLPYFIAWMSTDEESTLIIIIFIFFKQSFSMWSSVCGVCAVYDTFRIIHTLKCHRNCCRVQFIISRLNFPRIPLKDAAYLLLKIVTQYFSICMRLMGNDICSCDAIDSSSYLQQQKKGKSNLHLVMIVCRWISSNNRISGNFMREIIEKTIFSEKLPPKYTLFVKGSRFSIGSFP